MLILSRLPPGALLPLLLTAAAALAEKLEELENKLTKRLDVHEQAIVHILQEIKKLMGSPLLPEPKRRPIGFGKEDH